MRARACVLLAALVLAGCGPAPSGNADDPNLRAPNLQGRAVRAVFAPEAATPDDRRAVLALLERIGATVPEPRVDAAWDAALAQRAADVAVVPAGLAVDEERLDATEPLGGVRLVTRQSDRLRAALNTAIKLGPR